MTDSIPPPGVPEGVNCKFDFPSVTPPRRDPPFWVQAIVAFLITVFGGVLAAKIVAIDDRVHVIEKALTALVQQNKQ